MNLTNISSVTNRTGGCSVRPQPILISVFICLLLMLGFILNIFSLWVFKYRIPEWKSGTFLQFHLAISDLILCPLAPFVTVYFTLGHWPFGHLMCRLKIALAFVHYYGSVCFLTLISVHRYVSVVYHRQEFRMKRKDFVKKLCVGVWTFMLINGLVLVLVLDASVLGNRTLCFSIHQEQYVGLLFAINFALFLPGYLIPFAIVLMCYSRLARSVSGINICHHKSKLMKRKSCQMMTVCLLIFVLCFMPIHVIHTILWVVKKFYPEHCDLLLQLETSSYVCWILSSANCCFDPLIYCFFSHNFMTAFRGSLRTLGIRFQTVDRDIGNGSPQTTHGIPTPRMIQRNNMADTQL